MNYTALAIVSFLWSLISAIFSYQTDITWLRHVLSAMSYILFLICGVAIVLINS